jgi:NAD(P)-dependent dehydrogenase (short-subunit alcohol dehydrogenase family)
MGLLSSPSILEDTQTPVEQQPHWPEALGSSPHRLASESRTERPRLLRQFDLSGKCAVVVGGTSGLGQAIALALAEAGADVVASSRRKAEADRTAREIETLGRQTLPLQADVRSRESLQRLHDEVLSRFGHIDILVNSAGITGRRPAIECSEEDWCDILNVNLNGTFRACQIFGKTMLAQRSGAIINVASLATFVAFRDVAAYGVSKAGVGALTKSLAVEWAPQGVRVNAIAPGIFPTELNGNLIRGTDRGKELLMRTPMARYGNPSEVAGAAVFLASDAGSFVNGEILAVDGGFLASGVNS